jgi:hypothetical protein
VFECCGGGDTPGIITDDSETLSITWKSVVVGGACGAPDRGDVSKNGLNK